MHLRRRSGLIDSLPLGLPGSCDLPAFAFLPTNISAGGVSQNLGRDILIISTRSEITRLLGKVDNVQIENE